MKISVVIPAYNAARFLANTLDSVLVQLEAASEVIVVNDGSSDDTEEVVGRFDGQVICLRQSNLGVSAARNAGLAIATGDYVIFLDADDRLAEGAIEAYRSTLSDGAIGNRAVLYGDYRAFKEGTDWERIRRRPHYAGEAPHAARQFFQAGGHTPSAFMVSTSVAREVGGFDSRFSFAADLDFFMRCGTLAPFVYVPTVVVHYLRHDAAMSHHLYKAIVDVIDAKIAFVEWCRERQLMVLDEEPTEADLFARVASNHYFRREWRHVDIALEVASIRGISDPRLRQLARRRRLPAWVFTLKDAFDSFRCLATNALDD